MKYYQLLAATTLIGTIHDIYLNDINAACASITCIYGVFVSRVWV